MSGELFVVHRPMLFGLAYRLLGSVHDAEDVLQEAYLRWTRADRSGVEEPRRYLTRVVARLAVDALRARQARREEYVGTWLPEPVATQPSPESAADTSELSMAVLHLMERLTPPQRAVYVLHTAFDLPYAEIGSILERSAEDCRQLHHRANAALAGRPRFDADPAAHMRLLQVLVAAARDGDVERLEGVLHEDVVIWSDGGGKVQAARKPIYGRAKAMRFLAGIMRRPGADGYRLTPVHFNGRPGLLIDARHRYTLCVELDQDTGGVRVRDLFLVANPEKLSTFSAPPS